VAVASAGPYASLHLAADRQPRQRLITQFSTGRMPFLPPNQQRQSTEGIQERRYTKCLIINRWWWWWWNVLDDADVALGGGDVQREGAGLGMRLLRVGAGVEPLVGVAKHQLLLLLARRLRVDACSRQRNSSASPETRRLQN